MVRWLSANWLWILAVGGMLWMHLGMHRGHGGHAGHARSSQPDEYGASRSSGSHAGHGSESAEAGGEHRHRGY